MLLLFTSKYLMYNNIPVLIDHGVLSIIIKKTIKLIKQREKKINQTVTDQLSLTNDPRV